MGVPPHLAHDQVPRIGSTLLMTRPKHSDRVLGSSQAADGACPRLARRPCALVSARWQQYLQVWATVTGVPPRSTLDDALNRNASV